MPSIPLPLEGDTSPSSSQEHLQSGHVLKTDQHQDPHSLSEEGISPSAYLRTQETEQLLPVDSENMQMRPPATDYHDLKTFSDAELQTRDQVSSTRDFVEPVDPPSLTFTDASALSMGSGRSPYEASLCPLPEWDEMVFPRTPTTFGQRFYGVLEPPDSMATSNTPATLQPRASARQLWIPRQPVEAFHSSESSQPKPPQTVAACGSDYRNSLPQLYSHPRTMASAEGQRLPESVVLSAYSAYSAADGTESDRGFCPDPTCGKQLSDLKAHMETHQIERPVKCPLPTCEYHKMGFAREYDQKRHTLTHFRGPIECGCCSEQLIFNRVDVFKRHLISQHGVMQITPGDLPRDITTPEVSISPRATDVLGKCSTCALAFNAQDLYKHIDDCVLHVIEQELSDQFSSQQNKAPAQEETMIPIKNVGSSLVSSTKSPANLPEDPTIEEREEYPRQPSIFLPHGQVPVELSIAQHALAHEIVPPEDRKAGLTAMARGGADSHRTARGCWPCWRVGTRCSFDSGDESPQCKSCLIGGWACYS